MTYVAVMPWIYQPYKDACLAGCKLENVLLVDNSERNLGVMRSHNLGIDFMRERDAEWLVILSAAVRFGDAGGLDFIDALDAYADHMVLNAEGTFGWHCIAFRRDLIEAVGRWDENFTPYGYDDIDLGIRHRKAFPGIKARQVEWLAITDTIMGHSLRLAGVKVDNPKLLGYLTEKWGKPHGHDFDAYYDYPWDDATNPVGYWPDVNGARWDEPAPATDQASAWNPAGTRPLGQ